MKLRIRAANGGSSSTTLKVEVPAACSLQGLEIAIVEALECRGISFSRPLGISLNKIQPIQGEPFALLSQLGIRNGDLLFYFESGVSFPEMAGSRQSGDAGSMASSSAGPANKDAETARRRELCAIAASRRASSSVHPSTVTINSEDREVLVSKNLTSLVDGGTASDVANVSTDTQVCGPSLPVGNIDMQIDDANVSTDTQVYGPSLPVGNIDMQIDGQTSSNGDEIVGDAGLGAARVSNSIPAILQRILIAECGRVRRATDLLVLAVHAVMLETGFVVVNALEEGYTLPGGWSNGGIANISYTLPAIRDAGNISGHVVVKSLSLGNNVVVYGTITGGNWEPMKLSLLASKHIIGSVLSHTDLISFYSDLFELWKCAKDGLSLPLLTAVCEMAGLPAPSSFLVIPTELKMKILECLPALDLVKAGCSCSELRHLSANDELWKRLFLEEFGNPSAPQQLPSFRGWKAAYALRFLDRKRMFERRVLPHRPLYGISSRFGPRFPRMGGVIGGDYDIYSFGRGPFRGNFGGGRGPLGGLHGSLRDENLGDCW